MKKEKLIKTAEFVSPKHPDKLCDQMADALLDAYLKKDPFARTAIEILAGHNLVAVIGEVKSRIKLGEKEIRKIIQKFVGLKFKLEIRLVEQSLEIARGVEKGGAGDQGIMNGYATSDTKSLMPLEYELSRYLCQKIYERFPYDGKTQVTIYGKKVLSVVASFQNVSRETLEKLVRKLIKAEKYYINPAGDWQTGGFDADSGLTGRKLVIDSYGPNVPVGGGSFSGKDGTKVDRSAAYMARKIAVDYLRKYKAKEVFVRLAYAIGEEKPLMKEVIVDGVSDEIKGYDLTPQGIIKFLNLRNPIFLKTASWGHFGRGFQWDK
ncbi:MAG: methionine adenosyltransferase domain-containing protein [Patescibacteria group bacterium]|nr:methionine adenosyltransferase domain-containing protein [Patescibacteria group bacterium]